MKVFKVLMCLSVIWIVSGCDNGGGVGGSSSMYGAPGFAIGLADESGEHPFVKVGEEPLSTFGVDVDTASYTYVRKSLQGSVYPDQNIRSEEFINYFTYGSIEDPTKDKDIFLAYEVGEAPWNPKHRLVKIDLQAKTVPLEEVPPLNLVFLIDTSGSMSGDTRIGLVKYALRNLVNELREKDRISIVAYNERIATLLSGVTIKNKNKILQIIGDLGAHGSTAGGAGIQTAYKVAQKFNKPGVVSRVILSTDGDFNVGITDPAQLSAYVKAQARKGIYLTVHGYGMGNFNDSMLEKISNDGNGNYAYIDNQKEATKVFKTQLTQTLSIAAKDVKLQVDFSKGTAEKYRLIGYENRRLENDDFMDPSVDTGDMGSGHRVTALYEIVMPEVHIMVTPLPLFELNVRYKDVGKEDKVVSERLRVMDAFDDRRSADFCLASSAAAFAMKLRGSKYVGNLSAEELIKLVSSCEGVRVPAQREELLELIGLAFLGGLCFPTPQGGEICQ